MKEFPDFTLLSDCLAKLDVAQTAPEAQGFLCGVYCGQGYVDMNSWKRQVLGEDIDLQGDVLARECASDLENLYDATVTRLEDSALGFEMYMPDDRFGLPDRIEALVEWCNGLLLGLSQAGMQEMKSLPDNVQEYLADVLEITRLHPEDAESSGEEQEQDFMEIMEYVRMGIILLMEELRPEPGSMTLQ